jgi:glutathione S-transferase
MDRFGLQSDEPNLGDRFTSSRAAGHSQRPSAKTDALRGGDPCSRRLAAQRGSTMTMKLHSWDISPYSARVRMQIYAKGLTDIIIERAPMLLTQTFYQDHPIGRIPLLEIDGEAMPESDVIAEYLEEIYPEPSLLGATPRETAHIRTLARIGDIYLMNTTFALAQQTRLLAGQTPVEAIVALLGGQLASNARALDRMIGRDGFACSGRLTLADCALVPALFYLQHVLQDKGLADPLAANANVAAYWAAIQTQAPAAQVLAELHRGREERREMIRSGEIEKLRAASRAAREAAEQASV